MTKTHTRRSRADYEAVLARKEDEHLTYDDLAAESGIPVSTLQYWKRKLRAESIDPVGPAFIEVAPSEADETRSGVELIVGNDVRIAVARDFDGATLRAVVETFAC